MILAIGVAIACVVLSFLASVWSNSISRITVARAKKISGMSPKKGKLLMGIAEDPRPYVSSTLIILLGSRITATVLVFGLLISYDIPAASAIAVVALTFILFQVSELAPRSWILERPDQATMFSARPVYWLGKLLIPLTSLMVPINKIFLLFLPGRGVPRGPLTSEEEIKGFIDVAESEDVIEAEEKEMLHSIFEFGDTVVREVMRPRPDMVCVDLSTSLDDTLDLMMKQGLSRLPVIDRSVDNVVGIAYQKDVVAKLQNGTKKQVTAGDVGREPRFVPESKKIAELLGEMREQRTHMVIVMDEYGGVAGLATLEDLLEEIVGEIADEFDDEEPQIEEVEDGTFRVDAGLGIDELNHHLNIELPHEEWDSVGGLIGGTLGRVAAEGDSVSVDGLDFEVERIKGRRIAKVLVHRAADAAPGEVS